MTNNKSRCIAALAPELWFARLRSLAVRLETEDYGLEEIMRHAYHLTQIAPGPFKEIVECELSESAFEDYLAKRAFNAAAAILTSSAHLKIFVKVLDGHSVVEIRSELFNANAYAANQNRAVALVRCWIDALLAIEVAARSEGFSQLDQGQRKQQS